MVALLLLYVYVFIVTSACGILFFKITSNKNYLQIESAKNSLFVTSIVGFSVLTVLLNAASLFIGLGGLWLHVSVFILAMVVLLHPANIFFLKIIIERGKPFLYEIRKNIYWMLAALPFIASVFYIGTLAPQMYDAKLYYAQIIKWINLYPVVPGLGNLHGRLAFNSSYHVAAAFFDFSSLKIQSFYPLNSYFFLLLFLKCFTEIKRALAAKCFYKIIIPLGFLVYFLAYMRLEMTGPSVDCFLPILLYCLWIIISDNTSDNFYSVLLLSAFSVTLKISHAVFLLLPAVLFFQSKQKKKFIPVACILVIVILVPWFIRNIILSGYLIYPLWQIDLFSFDWKIPLTSVYDGTWQINSIMAEQAWIKSWAILPNKHYTEVLSMKFNQWFSYWFAPLHFTDKIVLIGCLASVVLMPVLFFKKKIAVSQFLFWAICFVQNVFWFLTAPDIRFAYGSLLLCFLICSTRLVQFLKASVVKWMIIILMVTTIFWSYVSVFYDGENPIRFSIIKSKFILPEKMKRVALKKQLINGFEIFIPEKDNRCNNSPVPCTPYYNPALEMRGKQITDGFRIK